jgi:endonuclease YncB( thermonuclease family)
MIKKLLQGIIVASTLLFSMVACGENSSGSVDYVNDGSVKLALDYKDHDFFKDGVGQVTLRSPIDGDTAHFTPLVKADGEEDIIKSRFYGIDTPESTGKVQPWGKAASNFTKAKLEEADKNGTIVVSAPVTTYTAPSFDSTGTRYVSCIWINLTTKNASFDSLILLNLWLVQEGYSYVKGLSDMPQYEATFISASQQAEKQKLNLWSDDPDPLFNYGSYQDVSLLDIKREILANMADATHENKYANVKVRIQGTVAGYANHVLYLQSRFTSENDSSLKEGDIEYAGINVFTGMSAIPSSYTNKNAYIQVCGLCVDSEQFGFQVTSATFKNVPTTENDAKVLISPANNTDEYSLYTFNYEPDKLLNSDTSALNCAVKLTQNVTVTKGYLSSDANEITLSISYNNAVLPYEIYIAFKYQPDVSDTSYYYSTVDDYVGKTFSITGVYTYHKTTTSSGTAKFYYQINPSKSADMVLVK